MAEHKNTNYGTIKTEGGNVNIGDQYINDLSIAYNQVYKEQVSNFERLLHSFKSKTARQLLDQLETNISQKERIEDIIKSKISFLKATCDGFHEVSSKELSLSLLNAYNLNKSDFKLKEIAALEYFKLEQLEKAKEVVDEILTIEEFNPVAWAVKTLIPTSPTLESVLIEVPEFIRENFTFRRILYFSARNKKTYVDLLPTFQTFNIPLDLNDYDGTPLSFQNYKDKLFLIESLLSTYSQSLWINFNKPDVSNSESTELMKMHNILTTFYNDLENTEIQSNHIAVQFFAAYLHFQVHSDSESVYEMVRCYEKLPARQNIHILLTANSLQQIDEYDKAIEILEKPEEKDTVLIDLIMFCQIKKGDGSEYFKYVKEYLQRVEKVSKQNIHNYFFVPQILRDFNLLDQIDTSEFIEGKDFDPELSKDLLKLFIEILRGNRRDKMVIELVDFYDKLAETEEPLLVFFAISFHLLDQHSKCCEVYEKFIRTDIETSDLYCYILSLYRSKNRHRDLLPLLLKWRTNFSFQEQLVRLEIDLRRQLFEWNEVIACCEYMFDQDVINEYNLVKYAIAIHESNLLNKEEKIQRLLANLEKTTLTNYQSYSTIISVLERSNFQDEALQLLFSKAKEKSNALARTEYFNFTSFREHKYLQNYDEIKVGVFLKFQMDGTEVYQELTEDNPFLEHLIGKKVGEEILIPGKYGGSGTSIKILRIMNEYLSLFDEIMEEVRTNPMSKIPMQSFDLSEYIDGSNGKSILDFFEGITGKISPDELEKNFNLYYNHQVTFSEMVLGEYSENFLKAYYNLTKERQGLTQINPLELGIVSLQNYNEFILDFTSMLRYFEMSRSSGLKFGIKFTIASSMVSFIKTYSTEFPPVVGKEYILDKNYYAELLAWINENCEAKMPYSKLDALAMAKEQNKISVVQNYGLDNCCLLLNNENALLISDDFFYFKMFPLKSGKIISPWLFDYLKNLGLI